MQIIILSARLKDIRRKERDGTERFENINLEKNKIRGSILDSLRNMEVAKQIQNKFEIMQNWNLKTSRVINVSGRWRNPQMKNEIFFEQIGDAIVESTISEFEKKTTISEKAV